MAGDKDKDGEGAMGTLCDPRQQPRDHSWQRQAATDQAIAETLARNTTELMAKFMALLNERLTMSMPTALKMSSGATGISAMPPLIGPKTRLSISGGRHGLRRLGMP